MPTPLRVVYRKVKKEKLKDLIEKSGRYDGKSDFAVVLQPFLENTEPAINQTGQVDYSFFTPDCFHLTIKGHEQMAKALWNNMLQPVGEKSLLGRFSDDIQLLCPSEVRAPRSNAEYARRAFHLRYCCSPDEGGVLSPPKRVGFLF
ncbi:PREDICTED: phospholipase B1, membrane-associated [Nanorana parkeri]|uniref:phospholipase B1, membrane-associated n=1 Tax=Nanorana parkeri TaxID=125878 RepID=UPI000854B9F9|nr:PREDICTED: phospholipase B1, membrane-associated [Nanorana parkeri]